MANAAVYGAWQRVLTSGTSPDEIQYAGIYVEHTFTGEETVIAELDGLPAGTGTIVRDNDWTLYMSHNQPFYCTKVSPDFLTVTSDWLTPADGDWPLSSTAPSLAVTNDNLYLYLFFGGAGGNGNLYKFNLSDGTEKWLVDGGSAGLSYNIAIDSNDNVYIPHMATATDKGVKSMASFSSEDGTKTEHTVSHGNAIWVDSDMGIVITGGDEAYRTGQPNAYYGLNLYKTNIGETEGIGVRLGGLTFAVQDFWKTDGIRYGNIITYKGYIYVLMLNTFDSVEPKVATPFWQIFKLDSDLNIIEQVNVLPPGEPGFTYSLGIFAIEDRITIIRQDSNTWQEDVFWHYDTDLNFLGRTDNLYERLFSNWDVFFISKGTVLTPDVGLVTKY